ncbi:MAG: prepilin peptidase [Chloroflexi bacterium]|nr:prepilin peptidase [Chloroflexota bacterium]
MGEAIALAVFGLLLGRFLNLTIDRLPPGLSPDKSPDITPDNSLEPDQQSSSHLGSLQGFMTLTMVPVVGHFGYLSRDQGGLKLFTRSLSVELVTVGLCAYIGYQYGLTLGAAVLVLYCAVLIYLSFVDLERSIVPNKVVLPALPVALALFPFTPLGQGWEMGEAYLRSLAGAGLGFGMLLLVFVASRGGIGAGDVKLAALLGAILGFPQVIAGLALGFVVGGLLGITILILRLKGLKEKMPYAPALIIGVAAVLLVGSGIYGWYIDLFFGPN